MMVVGYLKKKKMNDGRKDKNPTDGSALQQTILSLPQQIPPRHSTMRTRTELLR